MGKQRNDHKQKNMLIGPTGLPWTKEDTRNLIRANASAMVERYLAKSNRQVRQTLGNQSERETK